MLHNIIDLIALRSDYTPLSDKCRDLASAVGCDHVHEYALVRDNSLSQDSVRHDE